MEDFTVDQWKNTPVSLFQTDHAVVLELQNRMNAVMDLCREHDIQMVCISSIGQRQQDYQTYGCAYITDPSKLSPEVLFGDIMLTHGFAVAYSLIDAVATAVQDRYTVPYLKEVK